MELAPSPSPSSPSPYCDDRDLVHEMLVLVLVVLAIAAMLLLHILGSLRRLSSHGLLHAIVLGINTVSYPLVTYTIGLMKSTEYCYVKDYAMWAVFMLLLLGSTDNLTACRLDDISNWKSTSVKHLFKGLLVLYVLIILRHKGHFPYLWPLLAILIVGVLKSYVRIASMRNVSRSHLSKNMRVIAKYMCHEHTMGNDNNLIRPFNPVTMEGYRYMVAGEKYCIRSPGYKKPSYNEDDLKVITVEKIWRCTGHLLRHERGMLLKDVCLSMALSKMLNRRFAGFKVSEAGLEKTHDFVFKGLLAGNKPHQRAFRIIQEELVFVHDIYYTRYSYFFQKWRYLALCRPVLMLGVSSWLTYKIAVVRDPSQKLSNLTISITVVLAFLEAYQLYLYVASGWFKVALIRSYVSTPSLQRSGCFSEMVLGLLLRIKAFRSWKNTLGQYCIFRELAHKGRPRKCLHCATLRLVDKKAKKGCKKSVRLSDNVKKAVVDSLLRSNGYLTNGITSLKNNGVDGHLSWACDAAGTDGPVTRTILVWHIATTLCKYQLDADHDAKEEEDGKREDMVTTATTLSQYCMHLLAFTPDLLPDPSSESECILDESIEAAREIIKGCKRKENWCDELMRNGMRNGDGDEARLIWLNAARLAKHLIEEQELVRWKILSEFWAEMMLYVSPSDNARAHLESLARGGKFITQLWALLTHAGVLKRGSTGP